MEQGRAGVRWSCLLSAARSEERGQLTQLCPAPRGNRSQTHHHHQTFPSWSWSWSLFNAVISDIAVGSLLLLLLFLAH